MPGLPVFLLAGLLLLTASAGAQNIYNEISLPALMKKKQEGDKNMVIVDVRTNGEYFDTVSRGKQSNIGRIKGALHIELRDLQEKPDAVRQLDAYRDKDIYLICSHSYRSRNASNILSRSGFANVTNVQGGMTEWFRRYDELAPFMSTMYETGTPYRNVSSSQVANDLLSGKKLLLIGISNTPRFFYDSATIKFYEYYPLFKDALYFTFADSLKVLQAVAKEKNRPVVLFNMVNNGAAELAEWLKANGVQDVSYLVGNNYYFYEYIRNNDLAEKAKPFLTQKSAIEFITPLNYCRIKDRSNIQLVDLRHDTLFNKITRGIKNDFRYVRGSVSFPSTKGEEAFVAQFPGKSTEYVLMSQNGINDLELADALTRRGYKIYWLAGGLQRLEWYTINVESFECKTMLTQ